MTDQEVNEDLALDLRVYGTCYWKIVDGKKVRVHPLDIRYDRDKVPHDGKNSVVSSASKPGADDGT